MTSQPTTFAEALAIAQGQMKNATFDKENPHFKSEYASLAAYLNIVRKPLSDAKLALTQTTRERDGKLYLVTEVFGHNDSRDSWYPLPDPTKMKPQEAGSYRTYTRRYELCSMFNLAADNDDDDGNMANNGKRPSVDDGEVISKGQRDTLEAALAVREMKHDKFLKGIEAYYHIAIPTMDDIPAKYFDQCLKSISKPAREAE